MSRYIDADAYAAELWKLRENYQMLDDTHTADKIMHGIFRAEQVLKEQPTVDAVPVVRCKECKYRPYWDEETSSAMFPIQGRCPCECDDDFYSWVPDDNWFCADGEI